MRIFLSGPSGTGKSTVIREILSRHRDIVLSVSHTTRAPRPGEMDGRDYHFVDKATFEDMIARDAFLEWARVHDNYYGTGLQAIEDEEAKGNSVLFDIDVQGVQQAKEKQSPGCYLFIVPPDLATIETRLRGRGTEDEATIQTRLNNARAELACWRRYDYLVVNDDLEQAIRDIETIISASRLQTAEASGRLPWLHTIS